MASSVATDRAKKVKFYRNGDTKFGGKDFYINKRSIRTWEALLEDVTRKLDLGQAARRVCTPIGGTQVKDIDGFQQNGEYVVMCTGRFQKAA